MKWFASLLAMAAISGCTHVTSVKSNECGANLSLLGGRVVGRDGAPKARVRAVLFADDGDVGFPAETGADGSFSFGCVVAADCHVSIGSQVWEPIHVRPQQHVDVRLVAW